MDAVPLPRHATIWAMTEKYEETRDVHMIDDGVRRLAALYRDALRNEFPQYRHLLSVHHHWTVLSVYKKCNGLPTNDLILTAEFLPRHVRISDQNRGPIGDFIDYTDPRFTEDILSNILEGLGR